MENYTFKTNSNDKITTTTYSNVSYNQQTKPDGTIVLTTVTTSTTIVEIVPHNVINKLGYEKMEIETVYQEYVKEFLNNFGLYSYDNFSHYWADDQNLVFCIGFYDENGNETTFTITVSDDTDFTNDHTCKVLWCDNKHHDINHLPRCVTFTPIDWKSWQKRQNFFTVVNK